MANRFEQVDEVVADAITVVSPKRPTASGQRSIACAPRPFVAGRQDQRARSAQGRALRRREARQRAQARDRRRRSRRRLERRNGASSTAGKMTPRPNEAEKRESAAGVDGTPAPECERKRLSDGSGSAAVPEAIAWTARARAPRRDRRPPARGVARAGICGLPRLQQDALADQSRGRDQRGRRLRDRGLVDGDARLLRNAGPRRAFGRYIYLYATEIHGADLLKGAVSMCVDRGKFKVYGVENCWRRGLQAVAFAEIDTLDFAGLDDLSERARQVTGSVDRRQRPWVRGGRPMAPEGGPRDSSKAARDSAGLAPARDIWISSGLRSLASGLRESRVLDGWIRLEFLGFLVRNEPFQWVTGDPGANLFSPRPVSRRRPRNGRLRSEDRPVGKLRSGGKSRRSWQSTSRGSDRALGSD